MIKLIEPSDPRYFTETSDQPYDRHHYEFVYSNGQSKTFDSWEEVRSEWFNVPSQFKSHIKVLDRKQNKKKSNGGFK